VSAVRVVVNADDFGLTAGVNRGIVLAHADGIVTSTSLMVWGDAAEEAVMLARERPRLGLGLHVDLGERFFADGVWHAAYERVALADAAAVRAEVRRQVDRFTALVGRPPTHLDSHQHVHREEPARTALAAAAGELGVPLRHFGPARFVGGFYGQSDEGVSWPDGITVEALIRLLSSLEPGLSELSCHPGFADGLESTYRIERERELETLCDPGVRAAMDDLGLELVSFADVS
jgi:predicted glycoside hydrolase/deacetylase ChbG (UPF0249 family)